jgi:hypothetical protein
MQANSLINLLGEGAATTVQQLGQGDSQPPVLTGVSMPTTVYRTSEWPRFNSFILEVGFVDGAVIVRVRVRVRCSVRVRIRLTFLQTELVHSQLFAASIAKLAALILPPLATHAGKDGTDRAGINKLTTLLLLLLLPPLATHAGKDGTDMAGINKLTTLLLLLLPPLTTACRQG